MANSNSNELYHLHDRSDILNAINTNTDKMLNNDSHNTINKNIYDASLQTQLQVSKNNTDNASGFGELRASNLVDGGFTRQSQADSARDILASVERNGGETRQVVVQQSADVKSTVVDSRAVINDNVNHKANQLLDVINTSSADIKFGIINNSSDIKNVINDRFITTTNLINDNKYEALKNTNELAKQMAVGFSDTKYEALKNSMQMSKEMAECCCEIKMKVEHTSKHTQDLIEHNERDRLRDEILMLRFGRSRSPFRGNGNNGNGNGNGNN